MRHEWHNGGTTLAVERGRWHPEVRFKLADGAWSDPIPFKGGFAVDVADEILRLAPQALEAALYRSILETEAGVTGTVDGLRKVIEERDHAQAGLAEATEIAAELTAAWAAAVGEGVIPCTEDCGTKGHLGTVASAACRKALDHWREMEAKLAEQSAEIHDMARTLRGLY